MLGLLLNVVVHSAAMQDRDGALLVLNRRTRRFFPFIKFIFADAGYQGQKTAAAVAKTGTWPRIGRSRGRGGKKRARPKAARPI